MFFLRFWHVLGGLWISLNGQSFLFFLDDRFFHVDSDDSMSVVPLEDEKERVG